MPKLQRKIIGLDTEATGLDLRHGARPFMVQVFKESGESLCWEWFVDPLTRRVQTVKEDLLEIQDEINSANQIVCQNTKYDYAGLHLAFLDNGLELQWDWGKVRDTLLAGHLLASNQPHDLTTMTLVHLGINVQPYEDAVKLATVEARKLAKHHFPDWRIAKAGLPEMPSAKETVWKNDMWLPRAVVDQVIKTLQFDLLQEHPRQPTVGRVNRCTIPIGRGTKWGNPFPITADCSREEAIKRYYAEHLPSSGLLGDLPDLYEQVLGCYCSPKLCHGDVLRALCHPWWTVANEYGNSDPVATLHLWLKQEELIKERNLWKIYLERLKVLPIVVAMENYGVTVSKDRLEKQRKEFSEESAAAKVICKSIASSYGVDLELPKSGNNNSLTEFVFGYDSYQCPNCGIIGKTAINSTEPTHCPVCLEKSGLEVGEYRKKCRLVHTPHTNLGLQPEKSSKKTGKPSLDKSTLEHWEATLKPNTKQAVFVRSLKSSRKRDTAVNYLESYKRFWVPLGIFNSNGEQLWFRLHPSLNPTGTDTLRWSSQNPNEQNISKQEGFNLRYSFGPAPGREWWSLDAKNIELRLPAYESGETAMIELFERPNDPPYYGSNHLLIFDILHPDLFAKYGKDVKKEFESTWYQWTKNGNFAVTYGAVEQSGTADRAYHVKGAQHQINARFKNIKKLNDSLIAIANKQGYVETMPDKTVDPKHGYPLLCTRSKWGGILPTVPLNYHIQGTAMWWMMKAMIRCHKQLEEWRENRHDQFDGYMVMQVHDEIVFDLPKLGDPVAEAAKKSTFRMGSNLWRIRKIAKLMEMGGDDIGVPTLVSCKYHTDNWSDGISISL